MILGFKRLTETAIFPKKSTAGAAGLDLSSDEDKIVPARGRELIETGIAVHLPKNSCGIIMPRSGLAIKKGIDVGGGLIDEDYTGPIKVILFNHSDEDFIIKKGDRIAQLVASPLMILQEVEVGELNETERGAMGFGSTGI